MFEATIVSQPDRPGDQSGYQGAAADEQAPSANAGRRGRPTTPDSARVRFSARWVAAGLLWYLGEALAALAEQAVNPAPLLEQLGVIVLTALPSPSR
jgi:hypothetical protein